MSLSLAITLNALAGSALLGGLGYVMSLARRLTPHVAAADVPAATPAPTERRFSVRQAPRTISAPALQPAPFAHAPGLPS